MFRVITYEFVDACGHFYLVIQQYIIAVLIIMLKTEPNLNKKVDF